VITIRGFGYLDADGRTSLGNQVSASVAIDLDIWAFYKLSGMRKLADDYLVSAYEKVARFNLLSTGREVF
jgi:hypothetical protein